MPLVFITCDQTHRRCASCIAPSYPTCSGGHGACYDFPDNPQLIALLEAAEAAGKVISAVCHGPVGLVNIKDVSGAPLVANKAVSNCAGCACTALR